MIENTPKECQADVPEEYKVLRRELEQKMSLHNTLLTFTITTTVALITLAVGKHNPYLYLLPFAILIPLMGKLAYYRKAMMKISSYIIVFFESERDDLNWEIRNHKFCNEYNPSVKWFNRFSLKYNECLFLGILSYALYIVQYAKRTTWDHSHILFAVAPLALVACIVYYTVQVNRMDKVKGRMISFWEAVKQEENGVPNIAPDRLSKNKMRSQSDPHDIALVVLVVYCIPIAMYIIGAYAAYELIPHDKLFLSALSGLLLYPLLLIGIAISSALVDKLPGTFPAKAEVLAEMDLLWLAFYFLIVGYRQENTYYNCLGIICLTQFAGFRLSLPKICKVRKPRDMWNCCKDLNIMGELPSKEIRWIFCTGLILTPFIALCPVATTCVILFISPVTLLCIPLIKHKGKK